MSPTKKEPKPVDPLALKREAAGRYRTGDGRFEVEQGSSGWMVLDGEQTNELGLPLMRGPFGTLDEAKAAIHEARGGPPPTSPIRRGEGARGDRERTARPAEARDDDAIQKTESRSRRGEPAGEPAAASAPPEPAPSRAAPEPPPPGPIVVRRLEPGDDGIVRRLSADMASFGNTCSPFAPDGGSDGPGGRAGPAIDREGARRILARSEVHLLIASREDATVGFVLAFEQPHLRGGPPALVIEEIGVSEKERRKGVGRELIEGLWSVARERGLENAFAVISSEDRDGRAFFEASGGRASRKNGNIVHFPVPRD